MSLDEATSWALEGRSVEESWNHGRVGGSIVGRGVRRGIGSLGMPALGTRRQIEMARIIRTRSRGEQLVLEEVKARAWSLMSR